MNALHSKAGRSQARVGIAGALQRLLLAVVDGLLYPVDRCLKGCR